MSSFWALQTDQVVDGVPGMLDVFVTEKAAHDVESLAFSDLPNDFIVVNGVILGKFGKVDIIKRSVFHK